MGSMHTPYFTQHCAPQSKIYQNVSVKFFLKFFMFQNEYTLKELYFLNLNRYSSMEQHMLQAQNFVSCNKVYSAC